MTVHTIQALQTFGPEHCKEVTLDEARRMCHRLTNRRYENFSVLNRLVPVELRDDFAAVYAFCRWADDLGDEVGDSQKSLELLSWWRRELKECFAGRPRHPVFIALRATIERRRLTIEPFDDLIRAFEQDQTVTRYENWDQLVEYCRLSANPVGRLVLAVCGEELSADNLRFSDDICTALQLTNHWQDVRRDVVERNRIYIPREMMKFERFEERLLASARQGYAVDRELLAESRKVIRNCVERTWPLFDRGNALVMRLAPTTRPVVWLLSSGGQRVLNMIEMWKYETALHRPSLSKPAKLWLIAQAWWRLRAARGTKGARP